MSRSRWDLSDEYKSIKPGPKVPSYLQEAFCKVFVSNQNVSPTANTVAMQAQGKITADTINEIRKALDVKNIPYLREIAQRGPDFSKLVQNLAQDFGNKDKGTDNQSSGVPKNPSESCGQQPENNSTVTSTSTSMNNITQLQGSPNAVMQTQQGILPVTGVGKGNISPSALQGRTNVTMLQQNNVPSLQGRQVNTNKPVANRPGSAQLQQYQQQRQINMNMISSTMNTTMEQRLLNAKNAAEQMVKLASLNKNQLLVGSSNESSGAEDEVMLMDHGSPGARAGKKMNRLPHLQPSQLATQMGQTIAQTQQPIVSPGQNIISAPHHQGGQFININQQGTMMQGQNAVVTQQQLAQGQVMQMGQVQGEIQQNLNVQQQGQQSQYVTLQNQAPQSGPLITTLMSGSAPQHTSGMTGGHCDIPEMHSTVHQTQSQEPTLERRINTKKGRGKKNNVSVVYVQQPVSSAENNTPAFTSQHKGSVQGNIGLINSSMNDSNQNNMGTDMQSIQNNRSTLSHPNTVQVNQFNPMGNQRITGQGQVITSQNQGQILANQNQENISGDSSQIYVNVSNKNISSDELHKQVQLALESQGKNIKVLHAQAGAQTQVINSTRIRPTAPRPHMGAQHRLQMPRSSINTNPNVRGIAGPVRSDQQTPVAHQHGIKNTDSAEVQAQQHYNNIVQMQGPIRPRMPVPQQMTQPQYQQTVKTRNITPQMSNQMQLQRPMVQCAGNRPVAVANNQMGNQIQMVRGTPMQVQSQQVVSSSPQMIGSQGTINNSQQMIGNQVAMNQNTPQQIMGSQGGNIANNGSQQMILNQGAMNTQQMVVNPGHQGMMVRPSGPGMMVRQTGMQQQVQQQGGMMKPGGSIHVSTQQHQQLAISQGRTISAHQQQFLNSIQGNQSAQQQQMVSYTLDVNTQQVQGLHSNVQQQQIPQPTLASHPQIAGNQQQPQPSQETSPVSGGNNSNEPNILPLSNESENSQNITSVPGGAGNQSLVQGQEYLIQYSNGKKVIGIWDGKFFKVRGAGMSGSQESISEDQAGRSTNHPQNPQLSGQGGPVSSPDGNQMQGGGVGDKSCPQGAPLVNANQAAGDSNANWHNNLARRPIHDTGQPGNNTGAPTAMLEVKKAHKRPPRPREEGKYAVCKNCGAYSSDYDNCESCHKPIPEDAKLYQPEMGSMAKKPRTDQEPQGTTSGSVETQVGSVTPAKTKLVVVQTGNQQVVVDKKMFYGNKPKGSAVVIAQPAQTAKGVACASGKGAARGGKAKVAKGRGKANPKKSPEIETVTILSSDDETEQPGSSAQELGAAGSEISPNVTATQQQLQQGTPNYFAASQVAGTVATPLSTGNPAPMLKSGFRQRMEDESGKAIVPKHIQQQQQKRQNQEANHLARSQDLSSILVQLQSRSIRIGSYRGQPADHFKITVQGVQFTITWGEDCLQIHIGSNEITKVMCHLGESMPCMFLDTTPSCAQRLRQALEMEPGKEPFYDPQGHEEVHKRITVIFENLGELGIENYIRALFQVMQAGNPYFHKEGSLLEEIEYHEANQILIHSTPQASLQLLNLGLGVGFPDCEDNGEEEEPIDRSRSPSPARVFNGEIVKLFTYPPPPATGGITVTNEDLFCLNDGEFLNDVIIDFYLKYLYQKQDKEVQSKTHIFSSFFYRRLTSKQNKRHGDDQNMSIQEKRHSRVKTWTRHVDLFDKDFIIVPINESAHWYLAIICYPGLIEPEYSQDNQPQTKPATSAPTTSTVTPTGKKAAAKKSAKAAAEAKAQRDMLDAIREKNSQEDQNSNMSKEDAMDTDESSQGGLPNQEGKICKQPCILIFDSLAGPSRTSVIRTLREYLQVEWDVKKKEKYGERVMDKETVRGNSPKCPQQMNFSDCGVYVLQYVESFFEEPIKNFSIPIKGLEEWFTEEIALCKREELRQLIVHLQKQINPTLDYDPAQDGCMIGGLEDDDEDDDLPNLYKPIGAAAGQAVNVMAAKMGGIVAGALPNVVVPQTSPSKTSADTNTTVSSNVNNNTNSDNSNNSSISTNNSSTVAPATVSGAITTPHVVSNKSVLMLKTANLTAEEIVAAVTKGEGKS